MDTSRDVAKALLAIGAVGFSPGSPITFKSGIKSPVYVDNRKFPFYPEHWHTIISAFKDLIGENNIEFDVIAGVEAAGIPHSAALGFLMKRPSVFVRKAVKGYGLNKRVEGGSVEGKKVLLIEDLVSTGSSSLSVVQALRDEGAIVHDCLIIVSYGMAEAIKGFEDAKIQLHPLTTFAVILEEAVANGKLTAAEKPLVEDWLKDPRGWAERQGL